MPGKGRKKQNKKMKIGRCGEAVLEALTLEELVEEKNNSFGKTKKKIHRKKRYAGKREEKTNMNRIIGEREALGDRRIRKKQGWGRKKRRTGMEVLTYLQRQQQKHLKTNNEKQTWSYMQLRIRNVRSREQEEHRE